jgi:hypothetical protein
MHGPLVVHKLQALEHLPNYRLGLVLREGPGDVGEQVSMLHVLHCDEDGVVATEPSIALDKRFLVLHYQHVNVYAFRPLMMLEGATALPWLERR